MTAAGDCRASS